MSGKILKQIYNKKGGMYSRYKELHVGDASFFYLLKYELCMTFLKNLQGAIGLFLRGIFYRSLFGKIGKKVVIGPNVTIRNPKKIFLENNIILDEGAVLDAKGENTSGIKIGNNVFISKNVVLSCKSGGISIGSNVTIGAQTGIYSVDTCLINIGDNCIISTNCYFAGSGPYITTKTDIPMVEQGLEKGKPIEIESDIWLGGSVVIFEGVKIGKGSIVGAMSLVNKSIPPLSVAFGIPAKVHRKR